MAGQSGVYEIVCRLGQVKNSDFIDKSSYSRLQPRQLHFPKIFEKLFGKLSDFEILSGFLAKEARKKFFLRKVFLYGYFRKFSKRQLEKFSSHIEFKFPQKGKCNRLIVCL